MNQSPEDFLALAEKEVLNEYSRTAQTLDSVSFLPV